ncbi:MAG TPA: efflux RND transporter periplasmic adaptor subunit, partial [Cryomorphaceae bacterium]|nr:efflux RND transporter periplasmic adaptor subunit [Cryomorphaceae bacterium]
PDYIQIQQDYLEAKGQLTYLKSDYERQKNLYRDKVASEKNYLRAESDYTVTRVKVQSLEKKLKLMNIDPGALTVENMQTTIRIYSPVDGFITDVHITKGIFLNPSQTAIGIVNTDHLHLELNVFEKDLSKVREGQPIKFSIQEDKAQEYEASVYLVNKNIDTENRTIRVHGHISDEKLNDRLNPGMYVEANIYTDSESKSALPQEAVVDIDGRHYALVLQSSSNGERRFLRKEVQTGVLGNGYVEVLNGEDFQSDAEFLVEGAFNLITE